MANTISGRLRLECELRELLVQGLRHGNMPAEVLRDLSFANGTSDGQIDRGYYTRAENIAASTETTYDLAGSLTDLAGATITMVEVVCIVVANLRTTALAWLKVGPAAANGFGGIASDRGFWAGTSPLNVVAPGPDSFLCLYNRDGVPVTAGTGDKLGITTSGVAGSTNSWDLIVLGRSA